MFQKFPFLNINLCSHLKVAQKSKGGITEMKIMYFGLFWNIMDIKDIMDFFLMEYHGKVWSVMFLSHSEKSYRQ